MDFSKYKNSVTLPPWPKKPTISHDATPEEVRAHATDLEAWIEQRKIFDAVKEEYDQKNRELAAQFKVDLLEDLGLTNHPKADKFFSLCWEEGHSGGFNEVYNVAEEWAELLQ